MAISPDERRPSQHIVFDKRTGRILHTHFQDGGEDVEIFTVYLKEILLKCTSILDDVTDSDLSNLGIITVGPHDAIPDSGNAVMVDVLRGKIIQRPTLELTADKREIVGDGQDSATIEIRVVNAERELLDAIHDRIKVTVTRGKLSASGGVVDLVNGRATITLTSVNETVDQVRVQAVSPTGAFGSGQLILEFV